MYSIEELIQTIETAKNGADVFWRDFDLNIYKDKLDAIKNILLASDKAKNQKLSLNLLSKDELLK
jgi:hypothetical protein